MNVLDENFPDDQRELLLKFGVSVRQIGRLGMSDNEIIPLLHRLRRATFFTQDRDFAGSFSAHPAYCLVWLGVSQDDLAEYARRLLRHPSFATTAQRLGKILTAGPVGISVFEGNRRSPRRIAWFD